jgi:hypothetical protein
MHAEFEFAKLGMLHILITIFYVSNTSGRQAKNQNHWFLSKAKIGSSMIICTTQLLCQRENQLSTKGN